MSEKENNILDELEEESMPDMSYDEKGEEGRAVKSVDAAASSGKSAPARKGDKKNSEKKEKIKAGDPDKHSESFETKGAMINAMFQKMNSMKKEEVASLFSAMMNEEEEMPEINLEEDYQRKLRDLGDAEVTLSEEFRQKTALLFEAALQSKVAEEVERIEEAYNEKLEAEIESQRSELVEKVDSYLNYVVEQWMEENRLAIQNGLRTEIAENFMSGLKDLFVESYIDVPENKVDLVDDLADQIEELEEALSNQTAESIKLMEQVVNLKREHIVAEAVADLADTQAEKFRNFFATVDFETEESFSEKVRTVKEAHFSGSAPAVEEADVIEEGEGETAPVETASMMEGYLNAIRRINK